MDSEEPPKPTKSYGKRSMKQWVVIYIVVAVIVYAIIYFAFIHKSGSTTGY
jgi:flagellar basal body-associated protein FliL